MPHPVKVFLFLIVLSTALKCVSFSETYQLQKAITGVRTNTLSSKTYDFEVTWGPQPSQASVKSPLHYPDVYSFLDVRTQFHFSKRIEFFLEENSSFENWSFLDWLGHYYSEKSSEPWIYHIQLGWLYISDYNWNGIWIYRDNLGWFWTDEKIYPNLYINKISNWCSLQPDAKDTILYDHKYEDWFNPDSPILVSTSVYPLGAGEIIGANSFKRWEDVSLNAQASPNFRFDGWTAPYSNSASHLQFIALQNISLEAKFTQRSLTFSNLTELLGNVNDQPELSELEKQQAVARFLMNGPGP